MDDIIDDVCAFWEPDDDWPPWKTVLALAALVALAIYIFN